MLPDADLLPVLDQGPGNIIAANPVFRISSQRRPPSERCNAMNK